MLNTLVITIVHWNGREMLATCLQSIKKQTETDYSVVIVDNGSEDDSVDYIKKNHPEYTLIEFEKNTGFAYPHTYAIKKILQEKNVRYILTLNNDTELAPNFLEEMVAAAKKNEGKQLGSIQGKIVNFYDQSLLDCTGMLTYWDMSAVNRGQGEKDHGQYDEEEEVFGASASAALYTREALEATILPSGDIFDSSYFAYYEDVDLAWRMRLAGFRSFYTPKAVAKHIHSATGISHSPFKAFHIHRNHYYNILKNAPWWLLIAIFLFLPIRYILLLLSILTKTGAAAKLHHQIHDQKKSGENMVQIVLRSWKDVIKALPSIALKRRSIQKSRTVSSQQIITWIRRFFVPLREIIFKK